MVRVPTNHYLFRFVRTRTEALELNNTVYTRMQTIHTCAQVVWRNDPAKLNQYRLTPTTAGATTTVHIRFTDALGNPLADVNSILLNAPAFAPQVSDALGYVTFAGTTIPESLDIHADLAGYLPLDSMDNIILHNEVNEIILVMTAIMP